MPKLEGQMFMDKIKSIEDLLYNKSPEGFPCSNYQVGTEFEAGGAYEDWGWVLYYRHKAVYSHKYLDSFLIGAEKYIRDNMRQDQKDAKENLEKIVKS